jgi:hypothetical protein
LRDLPDNHEVLRGDAALAYFHALNAGPNLNSLESFPAGVPRGSEPKAHPS